VTIGVDGISLSNAPYKFVSSRQLWVFFTVRVFLAHPLALLSQNITKFCAMGDPLAKKETIIDE
jgi:hypothetical protein